MDADNSGPSPVYLTAREAQQRIGVSHETLRKLIKTGGLRAHKTGAAPNSHYRISEEAIEEYLRHQTVLAAS